MKYYTITDADNNPIKLNYNNTEVRKVNGRLQDLYLYHDQATPLADIDDINEEIKKERYTLREVELPLKLGILEVNISVIPLSQPNNAIKFI